MTDPPLSEAEVRRIFARLESAVDPEDPEFVLIGGQAVAFWTDRLLDPERDPEAQHVTTSKDIDFVGGVAIVKHCAVLLGGTAQIAPIDNAVTPNSGTVVYQDSEGNPRTMDFLSMPAGLRMRDVLDTARLVEVPPGPDGEPAFQLWVIHPQRLLESRVANLSIPGKRTELALDQLRASVKCSREYAQAMLDSEELGEKEAIRAVLNYNERIFELAFNDGGAAVELGIDVFDAVVLDARLPEKFFLCRLPQIRRDLEKRRSR
jgi:hypothetical protein